MYPTYFYLYSLAQSYLQCLAGVVTAGSLRVVCISPLSGWFEFCMILVQFVHVNQLVMLRGLDAVIFTKTMTVFIPISTMILNERYFCTTSSC